MFQEGCDAVGWDAADNAPYPAEMLQMCDFAIVCVDTPGDAEGRVSLQSVEDALDRIPCERVLLKSTVPPGTTGMLSERYGKAICYWPEYIGQSRYYNPHFPNRIEEVPFLILGGPPHLRRWFIDRLMPILGPTKVYHQCEWVEAELIKYMENAYFATKITFVNEFRRLSEVFGADWHTVREGWLLDPRVERMHTAAFKSEPGFDGKCLPKDLEAIVCAAVDAGYSPRLLLQVLSSNEEFRKQF
jgi:nucleotide sugar dehydrogenase